MDLDADRLRLLAGDVRKVITGGAEDCRRSVQQDILTLVV
jgi:hypothetical protein